MQRSSFAAVGCQRARYLGVACTSLSNLLRPAESAADIKLSWWQGMLGQQELNTPVVAQWSTHLPARWKTEARAPAIANAVSCPRQHNGYHCRFQKPFSIRGSIVVSISACHAEDPGSIPGRGGCASRGQLGRPLRAQRQTRTQLIHELANRSRPWSS